MHKRLLVVGSILAVALLLGVSFTSVIGYSSRQSNSVCVSPLYNIRTNRAIDNGVYVTTCDYIGKGKEFTIQLPSHGWGFGLLQDALERITRIDGDEFNKFIADMLYYIENEPEMAFINSNSLKDALYLAKANPDLLRNNPVFKKGATPMYTKLVSFDECCTCNYDDDCSTYTGFFDPGAEVNLRCQIAMLVLLGIILAVGFFLLILVKICQTFPRIANLIRYLIPPTVLPYIATSET
jgi:hypothetical protein